MLKNKRLKRYRLSNSFFLVIAIVVFAMGIGYAAISTTLEIDGTSDIDSASWNVHFANVQVTTGSVSAATPTITDNTNVSFSANLANPGDFYEFKIDVVNEGTLDAKLDAIEIQPVLTQEQSNYFNYTVTYEDGMEIKLNDALNSGTTETLLIRFEYLTQTDTSLYPTDDTNIPFEVDMTYIQGHGNPVAKYKYFMTPGTNLTIGDAIPNGVVTYNRFSDLRTATSSNICIRHIVSNNIIEKSYIGFVLNNHEYYFEGGTTDAYESNKAVLSTAFGSSSCSEDSNNRYSCYDMNTGTSAGCSQDGGISINSSAVSCHITEGGISGC